MRSLVCTASIRVALAKGFYIAGLTFTGKRHRETVLERMHS